MKASLMNKALRHLRSNVIAYLALFIALGGTGYAAVSIPKGSVGTNQLKNHAVTPIKFDRGSIAGGSMPSSVVVLLISRTAAA